MSTSKDKTLDDIWGDNEDWVDEDFDVAEVIEMNNSKEEKENNESDWDDYDSNDEIETKEKIGTKSDNNNRSNDKWTLKRNSRKNEFKLKNNKDKPYTVNTVKSNKKEDEGKHNEMNKSRRFSNEKGNNNKYYHYNDIHDNYDNEHYQNHNHHNRSHNNRHNHNNSETLNKKKNAKDNFELDELNKSFSRLMPINGWKPGDDDIEDYASDNEEINFNKHFVKPNIKSDRKFNNNNNNNNNNRNKSTTKKDESIHRIHYSEEKNIPKAPAAIIKKEIEAKKSHILESKWANQTEKEDNKTFNNIKKSRDYYRQKKISNKLDWDNGIKGSIDDYENSDDEYSNTYNNRKKLINNNNDDNNNNSFKHEHFTYENSSKLENSQSEPVTRPTTSNSNEKIRPSTTLSSMWA